MVSGPTLSQHYPWRPMSGLAPETQKMAGLIRQLLRPEIQYRGLIPAQLRQLLRPETRYNGSDHRFNSSYFPNPGQATGQRPTVIPDLNGNGLGFFRQRPSGSGRLAQQGELRDPGRINRTPARKYDF